MKINILILLFCFPFLGNAQDDSRWSLGLGYFKDLATLSIEDKPNEYDMLKVGFSRQIRYTESYSLTFGLEVSSLSVSYPLGSTVKEATPTILGLLLGYRRENFGDLFHVSANILFEYDFNAPQDFNYQLQNGMGASFGIGKEINLNELWVISIDPNIRARGVLNVRNPESSLFSRVNKGILIDLGVMVSVGYKMF